MLIARFEIPSLRAQIFRSPGGRWRLEWARRGPEFPNGVACYSCPCESLEAALALFAEYVCKELKPEEPGPGERRAA